MDKAPQSGLPTKKHIVGHVGMRAYKLVRRLPSTSALRSLFIDAMTDRPLGVWRQAEFHPTKGFEARFGWHCTHYPIAPHLSMKGRVWVEVELDGDIEVKDRPACQGGRWLLGKGRMKINRILSDADVALLEIEAGKQSSAEEEIK